MSDGWTEQAGSARARLLAAAAECFYAHGVQATGIVTITTAAGVAKMSLYNNFESKEALVNAHLKKRHREWLVSTSVGSPPQTTAGTGCWRCSTHTPTTAESA